MKPEQKDKIVALLKEKSVMKQDVYRNTLESFDLLAEVLKNISADLKKEAAGIDKRIGIDLRITSDHEIEFKIASDVLVFYMHTNVFEFEKSHPIFKTGYVKENELNSYCGIIYIYNFLADSFKYNRLNDLGYLIGRVFVNREKRFFLESKAIPGFRYNQFSEKEISKEELSDIISELIGYAIRFDLFTPPSDAVREVSLNEIQERIQSDKLKTGKRLGFRFQGDVGIGDEE